MPLKQRTKGHRRNKPVGFDCGEEIRNDEDKFQVRSQPQMGNDERNSDVEEANASDDTDSPSSVRRQYEPDWVPGSRYFQKLRAENNSQVVPISCVQDKGAGQDRKS